MHKFVQNVFRCDCYGCCWCCCRCRCCFSLQIFFNRRYMDLPSFIMWIYRLSNRTVRRDPFSLFLSIPLNAPYKHHAQQCLQLSYKMEFRLKQSLRWWWHNSLHIRSICCCWCWWWWWWCSCSFCWPIVFANSLVAMDKWHDNGCIDFRASAKNKWTTQHVQTIGCCYIIDTIDKLQFIHFIPSIESSAELLRRLFVSIWFENFPSFFHVNCCFVMAKMVTFNRIASHRIESLCNFNVKC